MENLVLGVNLNNFIDKHQLNKQDLPAPLLVKLADELTNNLPNAIKGEAYLDKAVVKYQNQASINLLIKALKLKFSLGKLKEANNLCDLILKKSKKNISIYVWKEIGSVKFELEKFTEAYLCYKHIINDTKHYDFSLKDHVLIKAAQSQLVIVDLQEINWLKNIIKQHIDGHKKHRDLTTLKINLANLEAFCCYNYKEAKEIFSKLMNRKSFKENPPLDLLLSVAALKVHLFQTQAATQLYNKAIDLYKTQLTPKDCAKIINLEISLKDVDNNKISDLCTPEVCQYLSLSIVHKIADIKFDSKQYKETYPLYQYVLNHAKETNQNINIPFDKLICSACYAGNYQEVELYFTQLLATTIQENISINSLIYATQAQFYLKHYTNALDLLNQAELKCNSSEINNFNARLLNIQKISLEEMNKIQNRDNKELSEFVNELAFFINQRLIDQACYYSDFFRKIDKNLK